MNPEKLKQLQQQVRTGGKGTVRRKKKIVHRIKRPTDEKKVQDFAQKIGAFEVPEVDEINMVKDNGEVLHFTQPAVLVSPNANTVIIRSQPEIKHVSEFAAPDQKFLNESHPDDTDFHVDAGQFCEKVLECGHRCYGSITDEICLPCLQIGCDFNGGLGQSIEDDCVICKEELSKAPVIQLKCGHVFHLHCAQKVLKHRWTEDRISFNFTLCPICKSTMEHTMLQDLLEPIRALQNVVIQTAIRQLVSEGLDQCDAVTNPDSPYYNKPEVYAMDYYSYYQCYRCRRPYFGGTAECDQLAVANVETTDMICPPCSSLQRDQFCRLHGTEFMEYKCRFCCSIGVYICFGLMHLCEICHSYIALLGPSCVTSAVCPTGPGGVQLTGACPLGIQHPAHGAEYCLGCKMCSSLSQH